jgi:hypothetical protein
MTAERESPNRRKRMIAWVGFQIPILYVPLLHWPMNHEITRDRESYGPGRLGKDRERSDEQTSCARSIHGPYCNMGKRACAFSRGPLFLIGKS